MTGISRNEKYMIVHSCTRKCQDETSHLHFLVLKVLQSLDNPLSISDYLIMMKHLDKPIHFYTYTCVEARALFFFFNSKYINTEYRNFKRHQTMLVQFQPPRKYTIIGKNLISPIQGQYYLHS